MYNMQYANQKRLAYKPKIPVLKFFLRLSPSIDQSTIDA